MGFLPFMLALPAFLWGAAEAQRWQRTGMREPAVGLVFWCVVLVSLHVIAAALFVAFTLLSTLARPGKRSAVLFAIVAASVAASLLLWQSVGPGHVGAMPPGALAAHIARDGVWNGVVSAFGVRWSAPEEKLELLAATLLCPFPLYGKVLVGIVLAAIGIAVWSAGRRATLEGGGARCRRPLFAASFVRALAGFAILTAALPTSLSAPDDVCLVDFRAIVVLVALSVAAVDARVFASARARVALAMGSVLVMGLWARQLAGIAREGQQVLHLVRRLGPADVLLALPFHDRSEYLDESNGLTHYLPVYHTVLNGGITSLFWGKFSHHLPVGYRPGKEPPHPPDWRPWEFTERDLAASDVRARRVARRRRRRTGARRRRPPPRGAPRKASLP